MTPAYQTADITLYHGDCLQVLPTLEAESVNAVIVDPPYGIGYENRRGDITLRHYAPPITNDDDSGNGQQAIDYCRNRGWPVCAFAHHRQPWDGDWRQWLVWDKGGCVGGGGDRATCWKFTWELIQVCGFGALNGQRDEAVLRYPIIQKDLHYHPTQKPLSLLTYLIKKLTKPGDMILDAYCGSGSTLVACLKTGRRGIGIEIDENYVRLATRRLREAETPLFPTELPDDSTREKIITAIDQGWDAAYDDTIRDNKHGAEP